MKKLLGIAMITALLSACVPPHHGHRHGQQMNTHGQGGHQHQPH